jgi:hypothetical protein
LKYFLDILVEAQKQAVGDCWLDGFVDRALSKLGE